MEMRGSVGPIRREALAYVDDRSKGARRCLISIHLLPSVSRSSPSPRAAGGLPRQADEAARQTAAISHRARHTYLQEQALPGAAR